MGVVDYTQVTHIYIVCGKTDMRRGIDGLAATITEKFGLNLFNDSIFLFCGGRKDRYKALYWDEDGFLLLYKRIENGRLQWPRNQDEIMNLSSQQVRWLLEGLAVQQPKAIRPTAPGYVS
jgi:transposase